MTDRDYLAAEFALGILEGEELLEARGLAASDPEFAREVAAWERRLAPLFDEIGEQVPPEGIWQRVKRELDRDRDGDPVALPKRLGWWKGMTAAAAAIAAALALVVAFNATRPPPVLAPPLKSELLVASLVSEDKAMLMSATWEAQDRSLTIMPGNLPPAPGRSHELWIIPADGTPRSLGLVAGEGPHRIAVPANAAAHFAQAATLAVSVEPAGGSPGPGPTGPVVASGALARI